ncbi:MAG: amino acid permease [Phycisphaerales bacterium]|nr:amino acid permease [Phycisphaerales bacterium]
MVERPTSQSQSIAPSAVLNDLPRRIGFWGAVAIMVGITIGTGIFRAPASVAGEVGTPYAALALWTIGGIVSLLGALTFAELSTRYPHSGGMYVFLREGFGPIMSFIFGWTYLLISKPAAAAAIAIVFAEHLNPLFGWDKLPNATRITQFTTCGVLIALTFLNTFRVQFGAGVAMFLTSLKVAALLFIVAMVVAFAPPGSANFAFSDHPKPLLAALAPAMAAILWTYDGWNDVGSVAGEVINPRRMLPRIFFLGTLAITLLYVGVNAAYLWVTPLDEMRGMTTVAPEVLRRLIGPAGEKIVTVMILISALGATHGAIITGARVTFAQARDGLLFRFLAHTHKLHATPDVSLWTQCLMGCIATFALQTFSNLADAFVFTIWIFYGLAGFSLFIMRRRNLADPAARDGIFNCPGYPWVPAVFVLFAIAMVYLSLLDQPVQKLKMVGILLAGIPAYYIWQAFFPPPRRFG